MKRGGEPDQFYPDAMVMFQFHRKAELLQYRGGDTRVEPPATGLRIVDISKDVGEIEPLWIAEEEFGNARTLAEVWGIQKTPFAGSE